MDEWPRMRWTTFGSAPAPSQTDAQVTPAPQRAAGIPPYARDGLLYQVETDELDVQYVAVYRVGA
jgi:hypothetical protein